MSTPRKQPRYKLTKNKYLLPSEVSPFEKRLRLNITDRDALLILTALHTGARAQELLNITPDDLIEDSQAIYIHGLKGSDDREIPVPTWLWNALKKYMRENPTDRVFPITYPRLVQIWNHWRPVEKTFHSLRHTFAIRLYLKCKEIMLVKTALGHRSITNTMIYADYQYSTEYLRKHLIG